MNKTRIDWCDMSWNPVTGCLHDCQYCYARKIANRFGSHHEISDSLIVELTNPSYDFNKEKKEPYPYNFTPTFHKYRLDEPSRKTKGVNIFVCSMADLFGEWVPDEWIYQIFEACQKAPQHNYLFLTKNPKRYSETYKDSNDYRCYMWFGTTATDKKSFYRNGQDLFDSTGGIEKFHAKRFVSIEPLHEALDNTALLNVKYLDWVIVGAETGNRKDKIIPKKEWIMDIKSQCKDAGVPLFMKESLRALMGQDFVQEFPWEVEK